ncbi:hypothetical protein EYC84_008719 [Monilinia fructicola]|uniref:sterol 3beta-glucosyltransferase n=1 Tax=Monilinia fructicola TaxID=38448 RepID=A0A5M9JEK1_MONFR|nr:hypothetical protein EYC84_008719 [Monilinia fructicola]
MELPERFRDGDDADEDCTAPHGNTYNMNQSVFGMIAAAGSQVDFNARFDAQSSDEEDDSGKPTAESSESHINKRRADHTAGVEGHRRKFSDSKLIRSLSRMGSRSKTKSTNATRGSRTPSPLREIPQESISPEKKHPRYQPKDAPVMSRMLDARAELSLRPSFDMPRKSKDLTKVDDTGESSPDTLAERLMEIFRISLLADEECIATRLYNEVVKSGYLSKSGKHNPKYNRYWFRLKGDVLSYYMDPSDLYFPSGNIDLRYGISANVSEKDKGKDSTHFTVETHQRTYHFNADSAPSAKEWVKALQKIIFRSHNDGDSVKISLPIENIMDIEDSQIVDFADTCKIRIIDNDETYALDEYFFSFFTNGKEALNVLKILVEDTTAQKIPEQLLSPMSSADNSRGSSKRTSFQVSHNHNSKPQIAPIQTKPPVLEEHVRATLSPLLSPGAGSPRGSTDLSRSSSDMFRKSVDLNKYGRRSIDVNRFTKEDRRSTSAESICTRRSLSANRLGREKRLSKQGSSDSYVHSLEEPGSSEAIPSASDETQASASQILRGSDVFLSPTIQHSPAAVRQPDGDDFHSPETRSLASPRKSGDASPTRIQQPHHAATTGSISDSNVGQLEHTSGPSLQSIVKAGAYPLQRAAGFAGYLNRHSKRMSSLLATESMGYVEKVSGMWKGGKKHYDEPHGMPRDNEIPGAGDDDDNRDGSTPADRFRDHFALPFDEKLHAAYFGYLNRVLPLYGSRGDVQPYIALCKGLMAEGHKTRIATHLEFKDWIESHGIAFAPVDGDPAELMRICVENGMFTYSFLKEASSKFRGWIDDLLSSAWKSCQDSDLLIESPSAMGGIHIAEALRIPYFRAFSMPWTRTRAYPHAFAVPEHKMGGAYNHITYVMFDNVFWKAISGQVNRWRKKELGLQATSLEKMQPNKVPFLYNFSPSVVVPPLDYSDWIRVTGYWFLDEGSKYTPPKDLDDFIKKARADGKRLVYVGFGSIVVADSAALTKTVVASVLKADVRCILSKGWSDRLDKKGANDVEIPLPPEIFQIKSAPHDWLFSQIDAAAHHGGAGTTGASLRAGIPTIIRPFFGDQFFFGQRVEDLGVGILIKKINVSVFSRALWEASHSERMITKAKVLGEKIGKENGVDTAIQCIYRDMEYAKSLIKGKEGKSVDDTLEDSEESWTFIGDDQDPELIKRLYDWEAMAHSGTLSDKNTMASSGSDAASRVVSPIRKAA